MQSVFVSNKFGSIRGITKLNPYDLNIKTASFADLDVAVHNLITESKDCQTLFLTIRENPLHEENISELKKSGWQVTEAVELNCTHLKRKIIKLNAGLCGYERDVTLLHELVHAQYTEIANDALAGGRGYLAILVEWYARKLRADPKILKHALDTFGFLLQVYDKTTYCALYPGYKNQLLIKECDIQIPERTMMDGTE